jgi:hypothetical protein
MSTLSQSACRTTSWLLCIGFANCLLMGCAEVQMGYNVLTYDETIARTANQLLLLNAVRASQHYPRSFTAVGPVVANPPISGNFNSTFNLLPSGLQTYNLNPTVSANAGYTQFALGNLNTTNFMEAIRQDVPDIITQSFYKDTSWPRELLDLIYIQRYKPSEQIVRAVDSARKSRCGAPPVTVTRSLCGKINEHIAVFTSRCNDNHFIDIGVRLSELRDDPSMYYNTAANYCHFERFRIFREELSLARIPWCKKPHPACILIETRSALAMIGYLGELISAQNYSEDPFTPLVLVGVSIGSTFEFDDAPLFVVKRGGPLGIAAVAIEHEGTAYYIEKPEFGSPTAARSLQTLDLVLQTVQAATHRDDLPNTLPSFAVVGAKL